MVLQQSASTFASTGISTPQHRLLTTWGCASVSASV